MKILFLDMDGVLNDFYPNYHLDMQSDEIEKENRKIFIAKSNFLYNKFKKEMNDFNVWCVVDLDVYKIQFLNKIVKETGCKIVISSSWRKDGAENIATYLTLKGFDYPNSVIDITGSFSGIASDGKMITSCRGMEISEWLSRHEIESFAILDDEVYDISYYYTNEVVQVKGLTGNDADAIISILNG